VSNMRDTASTAVTAYNNFIQTVYHASDYLGNTELSCVGIKSSWYITKVLSIDYPCGGDVKIGDLMLQRVRASDMLL